MKTMEKSDAMRIKTSLRASLSLFLTLSLSLAPFNRGRKGTRFFVKTIVVDSFSGGEFL